MRRLTWRILLRSALLATGVSIGLGTIAGQPLLRSMAVAAEEDTKPTAKKPTAKPGDGIPDVDALIKDAVGDALKDAGLDGKKPAKAAAKGNAADALRLKGLPIPKVGRDASADDPARPEKPKKGIDKLPKLTSGAKVIVNGETIALPHVLAYEAVSAGEWVTRIVATDKPIKQETLIEQLQSPGKNRDFDIPSPFLRLELNHNDRPDAINFAVQKFQTSAGRRNFKGEAIVEDGRVRGSIETKDAVVFGGRTITAEITFDVPLLTRDSKPGKQLSDVPKPEASGKLLVNGKPITLSNVVAYEVKDSGEIRTAISFTETPLDLAKLKAALADDGRDNNVFESKSQVKILIDKDDSLSSMFVSHDDTGFGSNSGLIGDAVVKDGRARGTVKLGEKKDSSSGITYSFVLTFDIEVLKLPTKDEEDKSAKGTAKEKVAPDQPKKGLAKLPKLESSGKLLVNDKPVMLGNVVAYELMVSGKKKTAINFTDKPIPLPKLKAQLAKDGSDMALFDFDSQVKIEIEMGDKIEVIFVAHDNNSFPIIGGSNVISDLIIEDGRARGTVTLEEPKNFSGKKYSIDLTFDVEVLKLPAKN